ncbi:DUF4105 domain-containing protein [bacterium]|nr:DUF4105 domain-containing protein [bacterium]
MFRSIFQGFIWACTLGFFAWAIGAIYYLNFLPQTFSAIAAVFYAISGPLMIWKMSDRNRARLIMAASVIVVFLATQFIRPSNDRTWDADHAKVADVEVDDSLVTIRNFRNCYYRSESDYDVHFETKTFPLQDIETVWLIVQRFTERDSLAHVFLSFGLASAVGDETGSGNGLDAANSDRYFSLSVEVRREDGEVYGPVKGIYRNYELTHVIGDERDLIGVRTVHRPSDRVYMYKLNATPQQAQQLFVSFADRIAKLKQQPEFYHTFLNNCANGITSRTYELTPEPINWLDPRIVMPGYSGLFAFENGLVGDPTAEEFQTVERASRIDVRAREVGITPTFSNDIRRR